MKKYQYE